MRTCLTSFVLFLGLVVSSVNLLAVFAPPERWFPGTRVLNEEQIQRIRDLAASIYFGPIGSIEVNEPMLVDGCRLRVRGPETREGQKTSWREFFVGYVKELPLSARESFHTASGIRIETLYILSVSGIETPMKLDDDSLLEPAQKAMDLFVTGKVTIAENRLCTCVTDKLAEVDFLKPLAFKGNAEVDYYWCRWRGLSDQYDLTTTFRISGDRIEILGVGKIHCVVSIHEGCQLYPHRSALGNF